ncbi:transmembrane amino acid transporter protein-domain-containing protein [Crucibulum laeve]|uniref:Transmembrane amino acid transporter protein-domain-containing protein n=1 Tax=Crucibulum laeve TaxID=68775 RepID=A0A5C3M6L8_9AGAR|nr:transmembrane amino acid transporter protein-domain-containing protein [Crucibulum laeve]
MTSMASLSTSFTIGSASSASVRDAIASYRRAQYLVAGSTVASASESSDFEDNDDEEAQFGESYDEDHDELFGDSLPTPRPRTDSFVGQLEWDEEEDTSDRAGVSVPPGRVLHAPQRPSLPHSARERLIQQAGTAHENTPLLQKKVSFTTPPHPRHPGWPGLTQKDSPVQPTGDQSQLLTVALSHRRPSIVSTKSARSGRYNYGGHSTFGQTLFNSIAILLGIGMLSEPLAFAYSGWVVGTILIISYGFLSCYTAKILARIILSDPRLRSYSDIGRKAFGPKSTSIISGMFCLELFAVSVILVTLYADSLHTIIPAYSANTYKLWGILILVPTVFLPLSLLSYTSILGILSTLLLVVVIFIDGLSKKEAPGSFWTPAPTNIGVDDFNKLGIAFGLFMAGFSGHAVIPSLARDMVDPSQFDTMINWAFVVATFIYTIIGYAGYLMFGNAVSDEISMDLLNTKGYNPILNQAALWMLVVSPLSKFALNTQPLNATIEILLGLDTPISSPEELALKPDGLSIAPEGSRVNIKRVLAVLQRVFMTVMSVMISILVPEFSAMMAFLGSFSAFLLCIVGPVSAKVAITGRCGLFDGFIIALGVIMAVWGTVAAFLST